MKKWNCNIVANMFDRVIRRKFGLLCNDDTSNEDFINSYINRLDCTPINLQCVDSQPCDSITTITECNLILEVDVTINENNQYVFISTILNAVGTPVYNWTYNPLHWIFISNTGGVLILQPINQTSSITTTVSLIVEDERGCKANFTTGKFVYLGGCTDPDAINYNPNATFDNGTCYYTELSFSMSYICQPDTSGTISLVITGGVGPYTVVGTQNGTNLPNGSTYSAYVIDSLGNTTPIQSGTISCPFDCESIIIKDNFNYVCVTDDLGNTGNAQIFSTPSGGTSPYSVVISINGNPPIPFVNGSIVSNLDELIIYIVDANGCEYTSIPYVIYCPPFEPGGSGTCEELESEFEAAGTEFYLGLRTTDRNFTGGGYSLEYDIAFGVINLPVGYTTANISNIDYTVENVSFVGLLQQYHSGACTICADNMGFPAINGNDLSGAWGTVANFYSNYSFDCDLNSTEIQVLRLQVNAVITFTNETNICYLCVSSEIEVEYLPCDRVFLTSQAVQMINPSFCDGTMPISPIICPAVNYKQDWTVAQIINPGSDPFYPYSASKINFRNDFYFSPGIGTWATTIDFWTVTINSIDNGTVCNFLLPPPCSTTQISGGFPGIPDTSGPTGSDFTFSGYILYPDNYNRISNINLTVYIKFENGCEYEGTFDITIDGNILGDTDSSGIISLTEL